MQHCLDANVDLTLTMEDMVTYAYIKRGLYLEYEISHIQIQETIYTPHVISKGIEMVIYATKYMSCTDHAPL